MKEAFIALAEKHPWLIDAAQWLYAAKQAWHAVESFALFLGMAAVLWLLRRERVKISGLIEDLGSRVEIMSQLAKAARDEFETAAARQVGPVSAAGASNWETVQTIWRETRDRIELAVEQIADKRIKPKYGKIPRYNYNDVIITLREDGVIRTDKAFTALVSMNGMFQKLKLRPTGVSPSEAAQFKKLLADVNGALPRLPKREPEDAPPPLQPAPTLQAAE